MHILGSHSIGCFFLLGCKLDFSWQFCFGCPVGQLFRFASVLHLPLSIWSTFRPLISAIMAASRLELEQPVEFHLAKNLEWFRTLLHHWPRFNSFLNLMCFCTISRNHSSDQLWFWFCFGWTIFLLKMFWNFWFRERERDRFDFLIFDNFKPPLLIFIVSRNLHRKRTEASAWKILSFLFRL